MLLLYSNTMASMTSTFSEISLCFHWSRYYKWTRHKLLRGFYRTTTGCVDWHSGDACSFVSTLFSSYLFVDSSRIQLSPVAAAAPLMSAFCPSECCKPRLTGDVNTCTQLISIFMPSKRSFCSYFILHVLTSNTSVLCCISYLFNFIFRFFLKYTA